MSVSLRIATPADAPGVKEIYDYYIENTEATFHEFRKPVEVYAQSIETLLETYPYFVAEDEGGALLGFANAEPVRPQSGYLCSVELTIYLHPNAPRHMGVGALLYEKLLKCLTEQGFANAYAVINSANEESLGLHRHYGFEKAADLTRCAYKHGQWLSAVWLVKRLNQAEGAPGPVVPFAEYRKRL